MQKKKENTWKIKKQNFKTEKTGSKINGKKRNVKKGEKLEKNGLVHLHFAGKKQKKQNKSNTKATEKQIEKAK